MRLATITLGNFKGIKEPQKIDFKAITLLFGPNSAGKSTVLQALHYLREVLQRQNVDPDLTIAGGQIDLGGFPTLVHDHDLGRAINIKIELDIADEDGIAELSLNSKSSLDEAEFEELQLRYLVGEDAERKDRAIVQGAGIEVEVRWSQLDRVPYVSKLGIDLDGQPIATIISPQKEGWAWLGDFNFKHPLLAPVIDVDDQNANLDDLSSPLENLISQLSREVAWDAQVTTRDTQALRIGVRTQAGALPDLNHDLHLDIRDPESKKFELETKTIRALGLQRLLDEMILGPARLVRNYLAKMTYLGPLREIPSRSYRPQVSPDEARWADGLAAWDLLHTDRSEELIGQVNVWLADETRLNTGYQIEKVEYKEIPVPSRLHQMFDRGLDDDDVAEVEELYRDLKSRVEIALRDSSKGIIVSPSDVGVGISQMVPVVVAALRKRDGLLAIEQPELHVHPGIQVGIGDLLIRAIRATNDSLAATKTLLVETHSEHIMLRLLRRIRETADNGLPPGADPLRPDDLSVIYVESDGDGVRFHSLRIDLEGEFIDHWPKGFFAERAEELF